MGKFVLDVIRKILQPYYIENSCNTAYYFDITNQSYCIRSFTKYIYFKRNILKKVLPNTFYLRIKVHVFLLSCQNKTYCS